MDVDLAIVGTGLSGSLVLAHLMDGRWLEQHTVVVIDEVSEPLAGRSWCYWSADPVVPGADDRAWDTLVVRDDAGGVRLTPRRHRYRRLSGERLATCLRPLLEHPHVTDLRGRKASMVGDGITLADGPTVHPRYILDSVTPPAPQAGTPWLTFLGMRTARALPDPDAVTLMDLAIPQGDVIRFVYVLPEDDGAGMAELTAFHFDRTDREALAGLLREWMIRRTGSDAGDVVETGTYPLLISSPRRTDERSLRIGRSGGVLRSATGYGVVPMARDARAISDSLDRAGHPFDVAPPDPRVTWLDRVFLKVMADDPETIRVAYRSMFSRNDPDDILDFLNGDLRTAALLRLVRTLPKPPFVRAAAHLSAH